MVPATPMDVLIMHFHNQFSPFNQWLTAAINFRLLMQVASEWHAQCQIKVLSWSRCCVAFCVIKLRRRKLLPPSLRVLFYNGHITEKLESDGTQYPACSLARSGKPNSERPLWISGCAPVVAALMRIKIILETRHVLPSLCFTELFSLTTEPIWTKFRVAVLWDPSSQWFSSQNAFPSCQLVSLVLSLQ